MDVLGSQVDVLAVEHLGHHPPLGRHPPLPVPEAQEQIADGTTLGIAARFARGDGAWQHRRQMTTTKYELDQDTALTLAGTAPDGRERRYGGEITDRWTVAAGPNGGYVAAFALAGVLAASPLPVPLTMTVHYLSRPVPGHAEVVVELLREGRGHATLGFRLVQDEIRAAGLATLGRYREPGPHDFAPRPSEVAASPEESTRLESLVVRGSLFERLDQRAPSRHDVFFLRDGPGDAVTGGWTGFADGRPVDELAVPVLLDCWPPAVFSRSMDPVRSGAPTIELTVHWRNRPGPSWHRTRFETRMVAGGYMDESGELWSEDGALVAESRQLARY